MTNEAVLTLAGFALFLALASRARAKWKTNADQKIAIKAGERWRLTLHASGQDITTQDEDQYREFVKALDIGDVESLELSPDHRTLVIVLRYTRDVEIPPVGTTATLTPNVSLTTENAEKL